MSKAYLYTFTFLSSVLMSLNAAASNDASANKVDEKVLEEQKKNDSSIDIEQLKKELKAEILSDLKKSGSLRVEARGEEEKIANQLGSYQVSEADTATEEKKAWDKIQYQGNQLNVTKSGFTPVPGTNINIRLYGFAQMSAVMSRHEKASGYTSDVSLFPSHISYDGYGNEKETEYNFLASDSRIGIETFSLAKLNGEEYPLKALLEVNFSGGNNGDTTINDNYDIKIRHAYLAVGNFIAGLTTSGFIDPAASGEIFGPGITGSTTKRVPQFRYARAINSNWHFLMSLEKVGSDFCYKTMDNKFSKRSKNIKKRGDDDLYHTSDVLPVLVLATKYDNGPVHLGMGGMIRHIRMSNNIDAANNYNSSSDTACGYGIRVSGSYKFANKDVLFGSMTMGKAVGLYISDIKGYSVFVERHSNNPSDFDLRTQNAIGSVLGYRHVWSDTYKMRSTIVLGYTQINHSTELKCANFGAHQEITRRLFSGVVNFGMNPFEKLTCSVEYGFGKKWLLDRRNATNHYVMFTTRLSF